MPVLDIYYPHSNVFNSSVDLFIDISELVAKELEIAPSMVWVFSHHFHEGQYKRHYWLEGKANAPTIFFTCKNKYGREKIKVILGLLSEKCSHFFNCQQNEIFIATRRVEEDEVLSPYFKEEK